jgi:competence protein ComEC
MWMKTIIVAVIVALMAATLQGAAFASPADKRLDVYWVDVEGGAATLLVTPAGESVLIDTGSPGERDSKRIQEMATQAGLKKLDHVIITHFHSDHYAGLPDLAKLIPVGTIYDHDLATAPPEPGQDKQFGAYKEVKADRRVVVKPGQKLALKQAKGTAPLTVQMVGALEKFATLKGAKANPECGAHQPRDPDKTDNKNSVVTLVSFGPFRLFDGGDITWNTEKDLVCPKNRIGGGVDVYQANHHGLDQSNNPVLVKTLAPTVAVVNNGPRKAGEPNTFATLKGTPSIKDIFQLHRNVRVGPEKNTDPKLTANMDEACKANFVKLSVDPQGKTYTVAIPANEVEKTYETRAK